jgi:hypothetical protein
VSGKPVKSPFLKVSNAKKKRISGLLGEREHEQGCCWQKYKRTGGLLWTRKISFHPALFRSLDAQRSSLKLVTKEWAMVPDKQTEGRRRKHIALIICLRHREFLEIGQQCQVVELRMFSITACHGPISSRVTGFFARLY